jgi:TP901 family phage tail tape measure protein
MTRSFTLPAIAAGAVALKAADDVDQGLNEIQQRTDEASVDVQKLEERFDRLSETVPASFRDIGVAVAEVEKRLDGSDEQMEKVTEQLLDLANITGGDIEQVINQTTRTFRDWAVATEDQADKLNYLFGVTQQTGIGFGTLNERLVKYGSEFRNIGYTFEETAALLGNFEAEGVATEKMMDGLRRPRPRGRDGGAPDQVGRSRDSTRSDQPCPSGLRRPCWR